MPTRSTTFEAIGTRWAIEVGNVLGDDAWASLLEEVHSRIARFDQAYSRFRADSLVTRMAAQAGRYEFPADGYALLAFYERLYIATGGRVTPLIGATMEAAGYDAAYSFRQRSLQKPPRWGDVIAYDDSSVTLRQPALLDFGAAGKGYLVDLIADLLKRHGLDSYLINAGGDILHRSAAGKVLRVGLENPQDTTEAIGIAQLRDQSLCASAGSKRAWHGMHHIIDPIELRSHTAILATWVVADDTMTADGLATALFFVGPMDLQKHFPFSYAILHNDMNLEQSADFPATVFQASLGT